MVLFAWTSPQSFVSSAIHVDSSVRRVVIDLDDAKLADHTFLSRVEAMGAELPNATIEIEGLDRMHASSAHPHATRRRVTQ